MSRYHFNWGVDLPSSNEGFEPERVKKHRHRVRSTDVEPCDYCSDDEEESDDE